MEVVVQSLRKASNFEEVLDSVFFLSETLKEHFVELNETLGCLIIDAVIHLIEVGELVEQKPHIDHLVHLSFVVLVDYHHLGYLLLSFDFDQIDLG